MRGRIVGAWGYMRGRMVATWGELGDEYCTAID